MDRSTPIKLIGLTHQADAFGVLQPVTTARDVFAEVQSVSLAEWSEGGRMGLNPAFRMRMFAWDYYGEKELEYNDETYAIYRTYMAKNDIIELYVEKKKGAVPAEEEGPFL